MLVSLLLSLSLGWSSGFLGTSTGSLWLVLLGDGHSLSVLGKLEKSVAASSANVSVWVVSHEGT
jgi:hypothetical protein